MDAQWNPWHGCHKISPGCQNCYVYRLDARHDRDASAVTRNRDFDLPVRRGRDGSYKLAPGTRVYTCFSSDFLLEDADPWRREAWDMIRIRRDLHFFIITKRIHRLPDVLPDDWGDGWPHVTICCTVENQAMADYRLPLYLAAPLRHKRIVCEPLLSAIDLSPYLGPSIENVLVGGESGEAARVCDYDWVLSLREQCRRAGVSFHFKQTGARLQKDGHLYRIPRRFQHLQARAARIDLPETPPPAEPLPEQTRLSL